VFDNAPLPIGEQINYNLTTGVITFNEPGIYYVSWFVATQFGLTTDGSNFAIVASSSFSPVLGGSSHIKVAPTVGFGIIVVLSAGESIRLINTSDGSITLSEDAQTKASLVAFAIN
jgi:hypothetical protein